MAHGPLFFFALLRFFCLSSSLLDYLTHWGLSVVGPEPYFLTVRWALNWVGTKSGISQMRGGKALFSSQLPLCVPSTPHHLFPFDKGQCAMCSLLAHMTARKKKVYLRPQWKSSLKIPCFLCLLFSDKNDKNHNKRDVRSILHEKERKKKQRGALSFCLYTHGCALSTYHIADNFDVTAFRNGLIMV